MGVVNCCTIDYSCSDVAPQPTQLCQLSMDGEERPVPSSPSVHAVESGQDHGKAMSCYWTGQKTGGDDEADEKQPLLGGGGGDVEVKEQLPLRLSKPSRWDWRSLTLVSVLWITMFFISAAYSMIAPFFPEEAADKGCTPIIVGVIISASPLCVFLTSGLFGYLLPKLGLMFTMLSGILLVGGAFFLMGFLVDMAYGWVFITFAVLLRMTEGVGSSMAFTAIYTLLPKLYPTRVGLVTGLLEVGGGLGFAIGPPIGGLLYTLNGFMLPFVSVGSVVLAFIPVIYLLSKQTSCKSNIISIRTLARLTSNFVFSLLLIGQVFCFVALGFCAPTFQPFLVKEFDLSEEKVGLVYLSGRGVYMFLALFCGWLSDRFGTRYFIILGFIVSGISFFFFGPADFISKPRLWLTITAFGVMGLGLAPALIPIYPDLLHIAHSNHPEVEKEVMTGVVSGLSSAALSLGEFVGPLLGGALTEFTDFPTASMLFGQVIIAHGILLLGVTLIDKCHHRLRQQLQLTNSQNTP